jgi:predicted DNA-binding ribbon-helix-helix protein
MTGKEKPMVNQGSTDPVSDTRHGRRDLAPDGHLRSQVIKRSLVVGGHKTSVSLEDAFWTELRSIATKLDVHLSQLVGSIDAERQHSNLSSSIRLFVFEYRTHLNNGEALSPAAQAVLAGAKRQGAMN